LEFFEGGFSWQLVMRADREDDSLLCLIIDSSPFGKNVDFAPSRFQSGVAAAQLFGFASFEEGTSQVAVFSAVPPFLPVFCHSFEELREALGALALNEKECDFSSAFGVARLLLLRCKGRKRCVCFVGSPFAGSVEERLLELQESKIACDLIMYGDAMRANRRFVKGKSSAKVWEIEQTHFSVAHALLDLPLLQKVSTNPYLLWQQAFGPAPDVQTQEDVEDDSKLLLEQRKQLVPPSAQLRSGHSVFEARLLQTELLPKELLACLINEDDEMAFSRQEEETFSLVMRSGKLLVLNKLASVSTGKCQMRPFGGLGKGKRRHAVISDPKRGTLSVAASSGEKTHVMWAANEGGAILDDIVVNSTFEFETVPDQPRVVLLHNRLDVKTDEESSVMSDFYFNGVVRTVPGYLRGEFRAMYWLASDDSEDVQTVVERLNAALRDEGRGRKAISALERFVDTALPGELLPELLKQVRQ
jgi:hypothetical protein